MSDSCVLTSDDAGLVLSVFSSEGHQCVCSNMNPMILHALLHTNISTAINSCSEGHKSERGLSQPTYRWCSAEG